MKSVNGWRTWLRPVIQNSGLRAMVLASLGAAGLASNAQAGSSFCPTCNLGTPQLSQDAMTPQFRQLNQNVAGILIRSRVQTAALATPSNFKVNWADGQDLPTFQGIPIPDFVLPDWVAQLTPYWTPASAPWILPVASSAQISLATPAQNTGAGSAQIQPVSGFFRSPFNPSFRPPNRGAL